MKIVNVKIEKDLHKAFKELCLKRGLNMQVCIVSLIKKDVSDSLGSLKYVSNVFQLEDGKKVKKIEFWEQKRLKSYTVPYDFEGYNEDLARQAEKKLFE